MADKLGRQGLREYPFRFTPRGLVDAFDATDKFPGACVSLANLVFDQSNPEIVSSRPGVSALTSFYAFSSSATVVSAHATIGSLTFGMVATQKYPLGKDEPFIYDHGANQFLTLQSVVGSYLPTTQAYTGAWTPPTIASVGVYVVVTHPGFDGVTHMFGWFDMTTPANPKWQAGDLTTAAIGAIPVAVANFNNRAYFATKNTLPYTDVLTLNRALASQSLTLGDSANILALSGMPVQTVSSGVIGALIAFKASQTWQITGDSAASTLAENYMSLTIGCSSPRSIAQSPLGLYFASNSGPMIIDGLGILRNVTHTPDVIEPDIKAAWKNAVVPSRMAGGYNANMYRLSMETLLLGVDQFVDYWFDEQKRRWTGPHTFQYDCASQLGNYFVLVSNTNAGQLIKSETSSSNTSAYNDMGSSYTTTLQSSTFPKTGHMTMKQVVESTQELASAGSVAAYAITALDDLGNTLNSVNVLIATSVGALWGTGLWGAFKWSSATNIPTTYNVPWSAPLVFKKMAILLSAQAAAAVATGTFMARYRDIGYPNAK